MVVVRPAVPGRHRPADRARSSPTSTPVRAHALRPGVPSAPSDSAGHSTASIRILAPSSALRDVIVANGVLPDRVTVDENHVVELPVTSGHRERPDDAPTQFLYMGGDSALKGADVLRRALATLAPLVGWELDAYGLTATEPLPDQVRLHPPFDPQRLPTILGAADVLIIPSIARESFSIAAREALAAGLAVITSDCLGPEEVVTEGRNGLVVPTGDAAALAAAMRNRRRRPVVPRTAPRHCPGDTPDAPHRRGSGERPRGHLLELGVTSEPATVAFGRLRRRRRRCDRPLSGAPCPRGDRPAIGPTARRCPLPRPRPRSADR